MLQALCLIGCGVLAGIGLVFLGMGRVSENYGDELGADFAPMVASFFFLLAMVLLAVA